MSGTQLDNIAYGKAGPRTLAEKKAAEAKSALRPESLEKADKLLHKAMERLSRLIEKSASWGNGIKKQPAEKINQLCDKWE